MNVVTPKLFYTKTGEGKQSLLLFHGFGQNHTVFTKIVAALSAHYTCFLFDLYFHGNSTWKDDEQPLEKTDWKISINKVLEENEIESFSILGYSLGAKFAFATLESFPEKTREIFLIAPDGIKVSGWYNIATYPFVLRRIFKSMIHHHERFLAIARILNTLYLVDKSVIRFAEFQMNTEEKRKRVYYSWVIFRHLVFDMKSIGNLINRFSIRVLILTGRFDKIIRTENMKGLTRHVKNHELEVLEAGHNNLLEMNITSYILKASRDIQRQTPQTKAP
jgi:pimeloyl-ACP methyl ester carboxylesterase